VMTSLQDFLYGLAVCLYEKAKMEYESVDYEAFLWDSLRLSLRVVWAR